MDIVHTQRKEKDGTVTNVYESQINMKLNPIMRKNLLEKLRKCQTVVSIEQHLIYPNGATSKGHIFIGSNRAKSSKPEDYYGLWTTTNTGRIVFEKSVLIKFYK